VQDLDKALADIGNIRRQLAAGTMFRGFGPPVVALTGLLALAAAASQSLWLTTPHEDQMLFLGVWVVVAILSATLVGIEMSARTRRHHAGLADAMLFNAVEQFLPVGAAGAAIAVALVRFAPDATWMLPGLWQILVGVGLFASLRFLPRAVTIAAAWYFVAGVVVLVLSSETRSLSPWVMGVPFGFGQFLLAAVLHFSTGGEDDF
jgi:hypothetical protein